MKKTLAALLLVTAGTASANCDIKVNSTLIIDGKTPQLGIAVGYIKSLAVKDLIGKKYNEVDAGKLDNRSDIRQLDIVYGIEYNGDKPATDDQGRTLNYISLKYKSIIPSENFEFKKAYGSTEGTIHDDVVGIEHIMSEAVTKFSACTDAR